MPLSQTSNPYMYRLRKKMMAPKQRQRGQNLSRVDRKAAALKRSVRQGAIWKDLNEHWRKQDEVAGELAKKHQKDVKWMRLQLNRGIRYGPQRAPTAWNAFIHCKSLEINEDVEPGRKARLQELQQLAKTANYKDIPKQDLDEMMHCLEEKRLNEKKGIRSRPAAHVRDVMATAKQVGNELKNLGARCQTSSLALVVRTDPSHSNQPVSHHDDISRDFIELLFGMDFDEFVVKFEAYALFRVKGVTKNANERKTMTKRIVGQLVKRGLHAITGDPNLEMEWKRYESKIVSRHNVELVGWPAAVFDPHVLGVKDLESCVEALKGPTPTCFWRKISAEELTKRREDIAGKKAAGEIPTKERKRRSDIGKKRGGYKKKAGKRPRETDDSDSDKENAQPVQRKKRSASIISSASG